MSDAPTEPSLLRLPTTPCPRCERDEVRAGVCPYCGPLEERRPIASIDDEWEELTHSRRRAEVQRARSMAGQAQRDRRQGRRGLVLGALVAVGVLGGIVVWWSGGSIAFVQDRVQGTVQEAVQKALPAKARTEGSVQLGRLARELHELAAESQQRLGRARGGAPAAGRLRGDLKQLHQTARELEPALTRDETRILIVLAQAERALDGYLHSYETKSPDTQGAGVKQAEEQIARAQAMLRGQPGESDARKAPAKKSDPAGR